MYWKRCFELIPLHTLYGSKTQTNASLIQIYLQHIPSFRCEPFEKVEVTVPQEYASNVVDMLNRRKGDMLLMAPCEGSEGMTLLTFLVPTRGEYYIWVLLVELH